MGGETFFVRDSMTVRAVKKALDSIGPCVPSSSLFSVNFLNMLQARSWRNTAVTFEMKSADRMVSIYSTSETDSIMLDSHQTCAVASINICGIDTKGSGTISVSI